MFQKVLLLPFGLTQNFRYFLKQVEVDCMVYGYVRVSTAEQCLERQLQQIRQYVDDERCIIQDKASGKDFKRPGYNTLVGTEDTVPLLREGDTLIITSIDRLGRNYGEIKEQWSKITKDLKVDIKVLDMPILNTTEDNGLDKQFVADLVLQILCYVADKERQSIKERQRQGIDVMPLVNGKRVSLKTGKPTGRPCVAYPKNWVEVYEKWIAEEIMATEAIKLLNLKRTTFYRLAEKYKMSKST